MRSALFRAITQCVVVIPYRRFGTAHRYHLQRSRQGGTDMLSRNVGKKLPLQAA